MPKRILVTGHKGYVAPALMACLTEYDSDLHITGLDTGFFNNHHSEQNAYDSITPEKTIRKDIRNCDVNDFIGIDSVFHLAAISNDPMGETFSSVTQEINYEASLEAAKMAKKAGVKHFIFASSCSVYGASNVGELVPETAPLRPVTSYAKSKILLEDALNSLADNNFRITCLRFATACGASENIRLDLVLNDFVFTALKTGKIQILSDGSPWRPIIDTQDMARAMVWAEKRAGANFLALNAGATDHNFQIKELAEFVSKVIGGVKVKLNSKASADKRSYRVNFGQFESMAKGFLPKVSITQSVEQLAWCCEKLLATNSGAELYQFKRLTLLNKLMKENRINQDLRWITS